MAKSDTRSRCWWFVQLLENLPGDWEHQLKELMIPGAYIVHDRDTRFTEEGIEVPKAPHIHCMLEFGNAVKANTFLDALPPSFGVLFCKPVPNKAGAYAYLMHINDKDKAQYSQDEITNMAGFKVNMSSAYGVDFVDVYELITELQITNFGVLMSVLVEFRPEFIDYVSGHVNLVKSFIAEYFRANPPSNKTPSAPYPALHNF